MTPEEIRKLRQVLLDLTIGGRASDTFRDAADIAEQAATRIEALHPGETLAPEACRALAEIYRNKADEYEVAVESAKGRLPPEECAQFKMRHYPSGG
jgi:hypothetical protein